MNNRFVNEGVVSLLFFFLISFVDLVCLFVQRGREEGFHFAGICCSLVLEATKKVEALHRYKKGTTSLKCSINQINYM